MPTFKKLRPSEVVLGRGRAASEARRAYVEAIKASQAGRVDLDRSDRPDTVKAQLRKAAQEAGIKVRSSWEDSGQKALLWKRTGS